MSDFHVHSFDAPRERSAPSVLRGRSLSGDDLVLELSELTLIVAIKPNCDGCRDFVHGDLHDLADVNVVVVSATRGDAEWDNARRTIVVAPDLFDELDIRSAPFYVLIDPTSSRVIYEGVIFGPAQVASEIASFLTS